MPSTRPKVCVVGGGIIGLSSAYKVLQDVPGSQVTVYSSKFSPDTTADISAGFIFPYACGGDQRLLELWFKQTLDRLCELYKRDDAFEIGIAPLSGYAVDAEAPDSIRKYFPDFREVGDREKELYVHCEGTTYFMTTYTCECLKYLPWLMKEFKKLGGNVLQKHVEKLEDVDGFDIVINCTGIEAKKLIPTDDMQPDRGQIIIVKAPWIKQFKLVGDDTYILPRLTDVVLGGTHQIGNYSLELSEPTRKHIFKTCCELEPSLKHCEVIGSKVGLRPRRSCVRVELTSMFVNGRNVALIHNYGHGGSGVTLHWGCAKQTSALVQKFLSSNEFAKL
uniref:D-aspartate oxidase n=1 Tax=Phallusia mammillata TaxID=59560 RepID=A0A6F9DBA1_9ASCI|nr:D-amino-acid oxidase-like [Phallusia mammillata]